MIITLVEKNTEKKNTFRIFLDNGNSFDLSEENYFKYGLYEKQELSHEEYERIKRLQRIEDAKKLALKFIQYKLRSSGEVYKKIISDGYDRSIASTVTNELKSLGYLNDSIYVQKYLYDRTRLHPKSKSMLKAELLANGVDERIIDEILPEWKLDDESTARVLVKKKFGKYDLSDGKILRRIVNFLGHRGFSCEIIENIVNDISRGNKIYNKI